MFDAGFYASGSKEDRELTAHNRKSDKILPKPNRVFPCSIRQGKKTMLRLWRRFLGLNEPNFSSNGETPRNAPSPLTDLGLFDRKTSPTSQDPLSPHAEQQAAAWAEDRPHGSKRAATQRVSNDTSPSGASPRPDRSAPKASRINAVRYGMSYPCHTIGQTRAQTIALREVILIRQPHGSSFQ